MRTDFGRKREDEMQLKTKTKRFSALLLTVGMLFAAGCGGAPGGEPCPAAESIQRIGKSGGDPLSLRAYTGEPAL